MTWGCSLSLLAWIILLLLCSVSSLLALRCLPLDGRNGPQSLLAGVVQVDPDKRDISIGEVLTHAFLTGKPTDTWEQRR